MQETETGHHSAAYQSKLSKPFRWTRNRDKAAIALANGYTRQEAADRAGVARSTIQNWLNVPEFAEEVDRLTFLVGVARKTERLRLAMRMIRKLDGQTNRDLLDWLKYAQSETDGIKLDLTPLLAAATLPEDGASVAGSRSAGVPAADEK